MKRKLIFLVPTLLLVSCSNVNSTLVATNPVESVDLHFESGYSILSDTLFRYLFIVETKNRSDIPNRYYTITSTKQAVSFNSIVWKDSDGNVTESNNEKIETYSIDIKEAEFESRYYTLDINCNLKKYLELY